MCIRDSTTISLPSSNCPLVASTCLSVRRNVNYQLALREHMDNEFLRRRRELDLPGGMRASSLQEYDASLIVPMWGYRDVKVEKPRPLYVGFMFFCLKTYYLTLLRIILKNI